MDAGIAALLGALIGSLGVVLTAVPAWRADKVAKRNELRRSVDKIVHLIAMIMVWTQTHDRAKQDKVAIEYAREFVRLCTLTSKRDVTKVSDFVDAAYRLVVDADTDLDSAHTAAGLVQRDLPRWFVGAKVNLIEGTKLMNEINARHDASPA